MQRLFKFLIPFILYAQSCLGQNQAYYNIDKNNGLASNHVYTTLVDKSGYLWISTTEGVYRYNGYTLTKYDYNDGLANIDVWDLYEDVKGKIWLHSISTQLGYIQNNIYRNVYIPPSATFPEIYPANMMDYDDNIIFISKSSSYRDKIPVFKVKNDTLYHKYIPSFISGDYASLRYIFGHKTVEIFDKKTYTYNTEEWLNNTPGKHLKNIIEKYHPLDIKELWNARIFGTFANKYIYYYSHINKNDVCIFNINTNRVTRYELPAKDTIVHTYANKSGLNIISLSNVFILDTNLNVKYTYPIDVLFKKNIDLNSTYFLHNVFWGNCLSTKNEGLFIKYTNTPLYKKSNLDLSGYRFLGMVDSSGYWWNEQTKKLLHITDDTLRKTYHLPGITKPMKIAQLYERLFLTSLGQTVLINANSSTTNILNAVKHITYKKRALTPDNIPYSYGVLNYVRDCVFTDSNQFYYSGSYDGVNKATLHDTQLFVDSVHFERYLHYYFNKKNNTVIAYSDEKIIFINTVNHQQIILNTKQTQSMGLRGIKKIFMDDYGNIFIQDHNKIFLFNAENWSVKKLFGSYILDGASTTLQGNTFFVAGAFGIIESTISGKGEIVISNTYPNTKNLNYNYIKDIQFSNNNILLSTDKGTYTVDRQTNKRNLHLDSFILIVNHGGVLHKVNNYDTIVFNQTTNYSDLDIIKPTGTGTLNIKYAINSSPYTSSGYQLILPDLSPGSHNSISIIASDNSWQSQPVRFTIYVQPHWWQTSIAKNLILVLAFLFLAGLIYLVIVLTRSIVNKNNDRKNQRRELELKSIYSQINPHFIFNSLSTAQYFVKKNRTIEAYEHINQFSNLLRSYIKSSRDKYITIAEELQNLENYLHLQLTRFENKFEYKFEIDPSVNISSIKIPSLLLQPLVENALNHGIFHSSKKGLLIISFKADTTHNELICVVDDNGIGRQHSKEIRSEIIKKADSYGSILIKELIDTFNKYETIKIDLEYIDKIAPETGTTVIIKIKNYTDVQ